VIQASQNETDEWGERLVKHWPVDLIASHDLLEVFAGDYTSMTEKAKGLTAQHRRVLEKLGAKKEL
jgi:hypothetical protein